MYLMGIDVGTSSTKSAIFDSGGKLLALASRAYTFEVSRPGYAEQDPEVWWLAAAESCREAVEKSGLDPAEIGAVGFSGQMHGLVGLDEKGVPVRKAILHCDVRAADEAAEIRETFGGRYSELVLNPIFPGFQAVSLYWLKKHEKENYERIRHVICPKDYVRYRMTGHIGTEHTDASGTLFYDVRACHWSQEVIRTLGFPAALLPEIHAPSDVAGTVTGAAAKLCGLRCGTAVVYGGADQAMHSLGNGVFSPGTMMATIGTSGQVLAVTDTPVKNPAMNTHTFRHAENGVWYGLGAVLYAGSTLNWFRRTLAEDLDYREMDGLAARVPAGCDGLMFLPCMGGERTPYLDPQARGVFTGISMMHTRAHFARAVMEGVSFAMKASIDTISGLYGGAKRLICAGGGVKGSMWAQIQADIYGREILVSKVKEQACLGAAITAGIGAGVFTDARGGCSAMCDGSMEALCPNAENAALYEKLYRSVYTEIYPQNAALFHKLSQLT